jgi:dolichol-phosphate mannosyltransferase
MHPELSELSIIVPFFNEEENVTAVLNEIRQIDLTAEIIAVDDGSQDRTWERIMSVPDIKGLQFAQNRGQSAAISAGLQEASREICVLMDGDGQNDPADIPRLVEELRKGSADVICGYRTFRRDSLSRRLASRIANKIRRAILDDGVSDTGCSLKVFPRSAVRLLVPFNGLHRFLPAIFKQAGMTIKEVPVNHRERTRGQSKYSNWERTWRGLYDLFGVRWLLKRKIIYPEVKTNYDRLAENTSNKSRPGHPSESDFRSDQKEET